LLLGQAKGAVSPENKKLSLTRWLGLDSFLDHVFALGHHTAAAARRALAFGPAPRKPRRSRRRRLEVQPSLEQLETRWVMTALSGITEYTVPTSNSQPYGITLGPDNLIWFTESGAGKIAEVTASGSVHAFPLNSGYQTPYDITTGPDNNLWFSEQQTSLLDVAVGKRTTAGVITDTTLGAGTNAGISATLAPGGALWVEGPVVNTIYKVTPGSPPTSTIYTIPTSSAGAKEITRGPDGSLWFTENSAGKIGRLTPSGSFTEWATPTGSRSPWGIAAGPDGNVWFTENSGNKVGRITRGGTITEFTIPTASSGPTGIVTGPDGNLWFLENTANQIGRLTPGGTFTEYSSGLTANAGLTEITVGADGSLWFTENSANKVGKFVTDPGGSQAVSDQQTDQMTAAIDAQLVNDPGQATLYPYATA
jgi:streptogramin lyase